MISGVPQGSVLGPLLFNFYINDLTDGFDSSINSILYADDVKIYTEICDQNLLSHLQFHLDFLQTWALKWQLTISESKCNILQISLNKFKLLLNFSISGSPIPCVDSVSDLGITVTLTHIFVLEVISITLCVRLSNVLPWSIVASFPKILVTSSLRSRFTYRPLVECSSQIWSPSNVDLINFVESIQRSFTKRIPGFRNLSYAERLTKIKLPSLEHRRLIYDLTLCFKIVHGTSAITFSDFFSQPNSQNLRGHPFRLAIPLSKNNVRKHFFAVRVIPIWNSLPTSIVTSPTDKILKKKRLLKHNLSSFLTLPSYFDSEWLDTAFSSLFCDFLHSFFFYIFHVYNVFLVLYFNVGSEMLDNYFNMAPFNLILFNFI